MQSRLRPQRRQVDPVLAIRWSVPSDLEEQRKL